MGTDMHGDAKTIRLDAVGGVAGDMFVAALLDAYPALVERVMSDIEAVLPAGCGEVQLEPGFSAGIRCLRFGLTGGDQSRVVMQHRHHHGPNDGVHHHHHDHDHGHHSHSGASDAGHRHDDGEQAQHSTRFADLKSTIAAASLSAGTAREATAILSILARAESRIHGVDLDKVHFHEVGDWDSLVDVVAAGSIVAALSPARWHISDLPLGGGLVKTQHGLLPVPAPATAEILTGFCWRDDGIGGERVTPTGAAIIRHLCHATEVERSRGTLMATGTGAGTRDLAGMPNILRVSVFGADEKTGREEVEILTFDIDDMTGEEMAVAADRLRVAPGVIDLTLQTLSGKKGRPACRFEIIAAAGRQEAIAATIFAETSTLGLRWRTERRMILPREETLWGGLRAKTAARPGGATTKVESDELREIEGLAQRRAAAHAAESGGPDDE
jgi:pyridinium-3,5-bisthiocarboxylic acid mononucleotide nickel chelatase